MNQSIIHSFKLNGRSQTAVTDRSTLEVSLYVEGPVESMQFFLYDGATLCWASEQLSWQPHTT